MHTEFTRHTLSTDLCGPARRRFFFFVVLVIFLGTAAPCLPKVHRRPRVFVVLVDTSAHQGRVIEFEREVVNSLADAFAGVATESFVITYADEVETLRDWSPLEPGLRTAAARIEVDAESGKNRRTLLNDALNLALSDVAVSKLQGGDSANSKVLIVVGEGNDTGSVARYSEVKKRAKSAHVQCFALLVADHNLMGGRIRHFGFDLYDLAADTNGKAYDVQDNRKNLGKAIRDVLKRVR